MKKFANFKMLALVSLSTILLVASVAFAQTQGTTQDDHNKARGEWRGPAQPPPAWHFGSPAAGSTRRRSQG